MSIGINHVGAAVVIEGRPVNRWRNKKPVVERQGFVNDHDGVSGDLDLCVRDVAEPDVEGVTEVLLLAPKIGRANVKGSVADVREQRALSDDKPSSGFVSDGSSGRVGVARLKHRQPPNPLPPSVQRLGVHW